MRVYRRTQVEMFTTMHRHTFHAKAFNQAFTVREAHTKLGYSIKRPPNPLSLGVPSRLSQHHLRRSQKLPGAQYQGV